MLRGRHAGTHTDIARLDMHLIALHTLRPLAATLVVCLFAGTVSAQIAPPLPDPSSPPVAGVDAGTPAEPPGGKPWLTPAPERREIMPGFKDLFAPLPGDFRGMFTGQNAIIAAIGGSAALVGRHGDHSAATSGWGDEETYEPGNIVGNFAVQTGAAFLTYSIGRVTKSPRTARVGAEIFRAQLVSQGTAQAIKFTASRTRPDGSDDHSFPSGHSASAFATATVLQKEFGWKAGIPAFAVAGWVAASRVQMQRHYISDVLAGATVGILAGRSVTVGPRNARFSIDPMPVAGGIGVSFTKVPRK
jgi:membrane-associated phospholipid phosphatase